MSPARNKSSLRLLGSWAVCLAVGIVLHFGLVARQERAVADSRREIGAAADHYTLLRNARSPQKQEQLTTHSDQLERRFADFVFSGEQFDQLDFQLRALAEKNHLRDFSARHIRTITRMGAADLKQIAQREMALSFTCTFPDLLRFVNEIERHHPILIVDGLSPAIAPSKGGCLSCTLECCLLYQNTGK